MIHDTDESTLREYEDIMARRTPGERLHMALRMYDFARELSRAGIVADDPQATEAEIRKQIFLRFYEHDLPRPLIERALQRIDERYAEHSPALA